jgi:hypothetical protein
VADARRAAKQSSHRRDLTDRFSPPVRHRA